MVSSSKHHKLGVSDLYSSLGKELDQAKEAKTYKYEVLEDTITWMLGKMTFKMLDS